MSKKFALVIGTSEYSDHRLSSLASPSADVAGLSDALASADLGQFDEVRTLVNSQRQPLVEEIWRFLGGDKRADDFVLVYYSGHGVKDEQGRLYLACPDTNVDLLRATAVAAAELTDALNDCRARRQVLILDCCNSGAFRHGTKGVMGESVGTRMAFAPAGGAFRGEGQGRVILTATDATQYAMEGDDLLGEAQQSVFTRHLLEGLRTGEADQNGDGWIGVDELYDYVHWHVIQETPHQQPCKFADDVRGEFVIARRPRGTEKAASLPDDLAGDLQSTSVPTRLSAVDELALWLGGMHIGKVLAAIETLQHVAATDDSNRVRSRASEVLSEHPDAHQKAISATPERITVLTGSRRKESVEPEPSTPQQFATVEPAANQRVSADARPAEDAHSAWWAWALRESQGDQTLASAAVSAAMAATVAGADSRAAAEAGRREIARLRAVPVDPTPHAIVTRWTTQQAPQHPQQPAPPLPRPPEAMIALVLGILSPLTCGVVLGPLAIWYGRRAQHRIRANPTELGGGGLAAAGIWLGVLGIVVFGFELLIGLASAASSGAA